MVKKVEFMYDEQIFSQDGSSNSVSGQMSPRGTIQVLSKAKKNIDDGLIESREMALRLPTLEELEKDRA